jgi:hypothetical protein
MRPPSGGATDLGMGRPHVSHLGRSLPFHPRCSRMCRPRVLSRMSTPRARSDAAMLLAVPQEPWIHSRSCHFGDSRSNGHDRWVRFGFRQNRQIGGRTRRGTPGYRIPGKHVASVVGTSPRARCRKKHEPVPRHRARARRRTKAEALGHGARCRSRCAGSGGRARGSVRRGRSRSAAEASFVCDPPAQDPHHRSGLLRAGT